VEQYTVDDDALDAAMAASHAIVGTAVQAMTEELPDITLPVSRALLMVARRGPQRPSDLAQDLGVSAATAGRAVTRLARDGLVERYRDPADGRSVLARLTDKGQAVFDAILERRRASFASYLETIPPQQQKELGLAFQAFAEASDHAPDLTWPRGSG
jgi:DNA-binding MarR family transcriptional regulator